MTQFARHRVVPQALLLVFSSLLLNRGFAADPILDSFDGLQGWQAVAPSGSQAAVDLGPGRPGKALRIDFDFRKGGGEVMVHKSFPISLTENFALRFDVRSDGAANPLEVRLIDPSGQNVWRFQDGEFRLAKGWQSLRVKQRRFQFGWGPAGGGKPQALGQIEFVVARGTGGHGKVWVDNLRLEPLDPERPPPGDAVLSASSQLPERGPEHLLRSTEHPGWHSGRRDGREWVSMDFLAPREYGGLIIDWEAEDFARDYRVEQSANGRFWEEVYRVRGGNGQRDYLPLHEAESRYLRIVLDRSSRGRGYGIRHIELASLDFSASPNLTFERIAHDSGRGLYPRYFLGEQPYWTVVGSAGTEQAGAEREALLSTDGIIEADEGGFSVEPFLFAEDRLWTWADGASTPSLERNELPIPSVQLARGPLSLSVTALADTAPVDSSYARYRVENRGNNMVTGSLFLTVRPFLVNPPLQAMHSAGGASRIKALRFQNDTLWMDDHPAVISLTPSAETGATGFDGYPITSELARNSVPPNLEVDDRQGWVSGAFRYPFSLQPGAATEVVIALPSKGTPARLRDRPADALWAERFAQAVHAWETALDQVRFQIPGAEAAWVHAAKSNLAYILIHRDGPALRPGSRRYGRTWIRDAAITSAALLAFGRTAEVREFLRWYAGFAGADGAVPCCMDPWGPDSMIEHDSGGEFLFTLASYLRHSGDRDFVETLWPQAQRTADYLANLRKQRLSADYDHGDMIRFKGLLPESVSHEGYMGHPVHSYWDDFWAVRGFGDAAWLADALGNQAKAAEYANLQAALHGDVARSIAAVQRHSGIDYLPGSAELADLDPTSTAIALSLGVEPTEALRPALERTFARYVSHLEGREQGTSQWQSYAPYEFRNVSALVRLGERDAALRAMRNLFDGRRPAGWNQWPEIVWRDPEHANFLGDLPHGWIGAEFIQAFLTLFGYEDPEGRLVLGAGLAREWLEAPGGTGVNGLRTPLGTLSYHVEARATGETHLKIEPGVNVPPGGIVIDLPLPRPPTEITINGQTVSPAERPVVRSLPAEVVFRTSATAGEPGGSH